MSAAQASIYVREMIHREARGPGDYENAMRRIEAKYGVGFWTLDHLRKGKAKTCDVGLYAQIKSAFADHCGAHARRLLKKAEIAQIVEPNDDVAAIETEIRALLARLEAATGNSKEAVK
jgi:hypothetical protein